MVPAPGGFSVRTVTVSSVTLCWDPPDNINTFEVTYRNGTESEVLNITGSSSVEVKDLHPGAEYTFSLVSVGENGVCSKAVQVSEWTGNFLIFLT